MADYIKLQADLAVLLNRRDLEDNIETFISLGEAQFNRDVRHWRMENRAVVDHGERYLALPTDWVETIKLQLVGEPPLNLLSRQEMQEKRALQQNIPEIPRYYRHTENAFELWPSPGKVLQFELEYYQVIPELSDPDMLSNWLLAEYYDLYLYGSAIHSAPFLKDDARITTWATLYGAALSRCNNASAAAEMSGSSLRFSKRGMRGTYNYHTHR